MAKILSVSPKASTPVKRKAERALAAILKGMFKATRQDTLPKLVAAYREIVEEHRLAKAIEGETDHVMQQLSFADWLDPVEKIATQTGKAKADAAKRALVKLQVTDESLFQQVFDWALASAEERAAQMVGMRWEGDLLVANPSADKAITESTRSGIKQLVKSALTDGLTVDELSQRLESSFWFSDHRAETIARTELADAHCDGTLGAWKQSGLVEGKRWLTGSDEEGASCQCADNEADGVIALDDSFTSGDDAPTAHPNCTCVLVAELIDREE